MGNHESVQLEPEIDAILNSEVEIATIKNLVITLTLEHEVPFDEFNLSTRVINLSINDGNLQIYHAEREVNKGNISYTWTPHTKMYDFEAIEPLTSREILIAKGAGICVIIVDCVGAYVKLAYNKSKPIGLEVIYTIWDHSSEAIDILKRDLYIGYHVLFIAGKDLSDIYELKHEHEPEYNEGKVWLPGLDKNLQNYEH